jgi:hypothetical protein
MRPPKVKYNWKLELVDTNLNWSTDNRLVGSVSGRWGWSHYWDEWITANSTQTAHSGRVLRTPGLSLRGNVYWKLNQLLFPQPWHEDCERAWCDAHISKDISEDGSSLKHQIAEDLHGYGSR